ncbi:MAG TPA: rhodanese-like domain-containing protein [Candidatus Limnocylindria bacterium]
MKKAIDLVAEAKSRIENLDAARVEQEHAAGVILVDLREPGELVESGRIAGSLNVPRGMLEFRADPTSPYHLEGFDPERRIILHCATGGRSALAAAALLDMGYTNVAHLEGGLKAWVAAGRPIETGVAAAR